jgi:hypothetical protein
MKVKVLGMRFRFTTVAAMGIGFMLGSKAGTGPWDSLVAKISQYQGRTGAGLYDGSGNGNGIGSSVPTSNEPDVRERSVPFTEI